MDYRKLSIRMILLIAGIISLVVAIQLTMWDRVFALLNAGEIIPYENAGVP